MEGTYKKSKGNAGQKGVQFQLDLVTVCLLNVLRNRKNWKISSENPLAGKYDDIVIELVGEPAVLIQAKHKENRKITKDQLLSDSSKNADFSLAKYFFSYEEVKTKFQTRTVIICTNTVINTKGLEDILTCQRAQPDSVLYHKNDCSYFNFNENILPDLKKSAEAYLRNNSRDKGVDKGVITEKNLKDFLKNLQIFSSYPCEDYLDEIIERSLFSLSCSSLCRNISSQEILRKIEDWFQQPKGEYLTEARAKAILCEIRSDKYCESLKDFNVSFCSNDLDIAESKRIIYVKTTETYLLQILKIYYSLQGNKSRKLYVNPDDAMEVQKLVVEAFGLRRYTFLIMAWTIKNENEYSKREINSKLKEILQKNDHKKVILMADTDAELMQQFGMENISYVDGSVTFQDLSKYSQERLMESDNIFFQGVRITLQKLLNTQVAEDYTKSLDLEVLEKLVRGKEIKVGVRPLVLDKDTAQCYVSRKFQTKIDETRGIRNIITEENLYNVKEKIIAISDSAGMGKSTVLTKMAFTIKKTYPDLWVIKINLYDFTTALRDFVKINRKQIHATELLNSLEATKMTNKFEKLIFSISGKVVLMLDGVDEISPDYTDLVLSLLSHCQEAPNFAKIFVTTRPHVDFKLNEVGSFIMLPFSVLEQIDFLTHYWIHNLHLSHKNIKKCKQYATILIKNISSWIIPHHYWQTRFTDMPLQVRMLADIFQENIKGQESGNWEGCREYLERDGTELKLPKKFNIAELYDTFIEKKRDVFIDKSSLSGSVAATPALLNQFESCLAYHRSLAVSIILPEYEQLFKTKIPEDKDTEEYILKIGIVQRLDGCVHFIHRTFAEYFLANCIVQELKLQNPDANFQRLFINIILWSDEFKIVRSFLDILLQRISLPPNIFKQYQSLKYEESNLNLFFELIREGHVAILRLILESVDFKVIKDQNINVSDWRLKLPFRKRNTLNDLASLVGKAGVNIQTEDMDTPLHLAVKEGQLEMVDFLVEYGANVNLRDGLGESVLHIAASRGALEVVACLVEHGVDINAKNSEKDTALHLVTYRKNWNVVKYLVEHGADVNTRGYGGVTVLHVATILNKMDTVEYSLEQNPNNMKACKNNTTFHNENWNIIKYLVENSADVNAVDEEGSTALHFAAKLNKMDNVEYLLQHDADISIKDNKNNTALHLAISAEHWNIAKYLVERGADVNAGDEEGLTALHFAAKLNKMDIVEYLLQYDARINMKDNKNNTVLHLAISSENWTIFKYFVERGADVNAVDEEGLTPLHFAAKFNKMDIVVYLLQHDADISVKDNKNNTALHLATSAEHWNVAKYLVERGADVNDGDEEGLTPLHFAAKLNKMDIVRYLLQYDADISMKDNKNNTALHLAISAENKILAKYLVEHGADVNAENVDGITALHFAAKLNEMDIVKYLLQHDADINIKDNKNNTALNIATSAENWNVVRYLEKHGVEAKDGQGRTSVMPTYTHPSVVHTLLSVEYQEDDSFY